MDTTTTATKVALYARVSTGSQSVELQVDALRRLAELRGWTDIELYVDRGVSGSKDRRPELDRMMIDARAGKLSVVACWKFDRFARSVKHLVTALEEFRSLNIDFCSLTENVDTSTPSGRMLFQVLAAMGEFERSLCIERVRAGLAKARQNGVRLGRPRRVTNEQTERAVRLRAEGVSWKTVAMSVGCPISTIRDAVAELAAKNPAA